MFEFIFSNKTTLSTNKNSYPITIEDVKAKSFYFKDNPEDDTFDDYITNFIIPKVVDNWEDETKYILLDSTIQSFVPNIEFINSNRLAISLDNLNVRNVSNIKYYEYDTDLPESKVILDSDYYNLSQESKKTSRKITLRTDVLPLQLFPIENNLECNYVAGFEDNDFTDLDVDIKNCLASQASIIFDVKQGYCDNYYRDFIEDVYNKYTLKKRLISIL